MTEWNEHGAVVECVAPGSLAERAGVRPGDRITAINGEAFADLIDYRFLISDTVARLDLVRDGQPRSVQIHKEVDQGLGITFTQGVFDGIRRCRNSCVFCFLHQMPRGMRKSLYIPDDDYRLSVTQGNYVPLTNVTEEDLRRILRLHLSPLFISVHATDPGARARLLRCAGNAEVLPLMRRLADAGIEMHCQIVLCPSFNDGEVLDQTLADLAALHPEVLSIAVVPVGLTRYRERLTALEPVTPEGARETLARLERWRERFLAEHGTRLVFAADEFYILAGEPLPPRDAYEEFPQTEDGIGLSRLFLDELEQLRGRPAKPVPQPERVFLVTGMLAHPMVEALAGELSRITGHRVEALAVANRFFGERITVTGLLTGGDILAAIRAAGPANRVYVPDVLLNAGRFLDDMTLSQMAEALGVPVEAVAPSPLALARALAA
ncbi:MAG TPA: DUF512 domain-containing protein [Armatimonadota bacterium]|nr:DUF512 domain-containing protein [Armatimonadota bacterium]